jgi:hypothetical protein
LLTGEPFLEFVRAGSAAEVIILPPNIFCYGRSSWNKHQADRILDHVIITWSETLRFVSPLDLLDDPPDEKVQYDK